jgi:DNA-binding FrmR family transcriptional regulator
LSVLFALTVAILGDRIAGMANSVVHKSHNEIVKRLKRAEGHLRSIVGMIEEQRSCPDIAQQLQAVEKAINAAKKALIHDHIDHCLDQVAATPTRANRSSIDAFKQIAKYL